MKHDSDYSPLLKIAEEIADEEAKTVKPVRFFWMQNYEIGDGFHWALNDTESQKEGKISCCYMVLFADYKNAADGRTVGEQDMPALIVRLLNEHYAKKQETHTP